MTTTIHPYFTAKAREVFTNRQGDPDVSGDLARWAQDAREQGDELRGVIITDQGQIVAETRRTPGTASTCGGTYVTSVADDIPTDRILNGSEIGLAMGGLRRITGRPVIYVRYSEVCQGAEKFNHA